MDWISIANYFIANATAAAAGILYWWTVENLQPFSTPRRRPEKVVFAIVLIFFFTPIVALFISMFMRSRKIVKDIKQADEERMGTP